MVVPSDDELRRIYADAKTIAVVGASNDPAKQSNRIGRYLQSQGYRIIPITPKGGEVFGEHAFTALNEVDVPIDVVDVFRPAEETPDVARAAAAAGAKVLWLQSGTHSDEAVTIAQDAGVVAVTNVCMGETHKRLGLGPGPS